MALYERPRGVIKNNSCIITVQSSILQLFTMIYAMPFSTQRLAGTVFVSLCCTLAFVIGQPATDLLAYDRFAVEGLETWRLVTANFVHTNGYHLLLNLGGGWLLWALHKEHYRFLRYCKVMLWCSFATSAGIYFFSSSMIWYVGLSGALHGLFIWGACMDIRTGLKSGWLLLVGGAMKVIYEQYFGSSEQVASIIEANVATDAHLYGAIAGGVLFLLMYPPKTKFSPP